MPRDGERELTMKIATLPPDDKRTFSIDFESTYSKTNSLKIKPTWAYVYDPETEIYLLSVAGPDNFVWVGRPQDFDWAMLEGKIVLAHNMGFDGLVLRRLEEEGVIPKINYAELHCTADMAAYFKLPRALKDIAQFVFKMPDVAKKGREVRDRMKGLPVERMMDDPEIRTYAANDAILCRKLWMEWSENWPEIERKVSRIAREGGWRGVKIDMDYVDDCVARLHERMFDAAKSIPWEWDPQKTPLARKKMIEQAQQEVVEWRELESEEFQAINQLDPSDSESVTVALNELWFGEDPKRVFPCRIDVDAETGRWMLTKYMWYPSSFAKDDEDCAEWEDEYGDTYGWIGAVRDWRRYNMLLRKFQHLQKFTSADGKYRVQLKYFGGHTGRWSGAGFFNVQNLPKYEMFCLLDENKKPIKGTGFDLRRALVGPFYVTDYMQVEARALLAQVRDEATLEKIRAGMSVYEAHARATMGWDGGDLKDAGKKNPEHDRLYRLAKARVLGAGYGCGKAKFGAVARIMAGLELTPAQAEEAINEYRAANPKIVKYWRRCQDALEKAAEARKELMVFRLPSGRPMYYWNVRKRTIKVVRKTDEGDKLVDKTEIFSQTAKNDPSSYRRIYGPLAVENITSGTSRDVLRDGWVALHEAGYDVAFTAHDEYVVELKPGQTGEDVDKLLLETGNNSWAAFIPLGLDGHLVDFYTK